MNVLVIGSGGREHALVHALKKSPIVKTIWCAPGNAGIASEAECVPIAMTRTADLLAFARDKKIDLTMVGPEGPLVAGFVDEFRAAGLHVVGPTQAAAQLEGSKIFAKEFMRRYDIPTARFDQLSTLAEIPGVVARWPERSVVKADGLAAGKGVKVCVSVAEANEFLHDILERNVFGAAGATAIVEECLDGEEATLLAFCDGKTLVPMPASQDHKRLKDHDLGPNTGGMGAYAPAPLVDATRLREIDETIFKPFLRGLREERFDYRGIIYFGLMLTSSGPKVLEFNVRFGDPETQVVLPLLDTDLSEILMAVVDQKLSDVQVRWKAQSAMTVVLASAGYPGKNESGKEIHGLPVRQRPELQVYHAGTALNGTSVVTAGGRVLAVTALAPTLEGARDHAYEGLHGISFDGMIFRTDIGAKALSGARV